MKLIGLTGGIASGKSTIARRLAKWGAVHIDADQLARDAVAAGTPALQKIRDRFGDEVIAADHSLDRAALGSLVFDSAQRRSDLEQIVHPAVRQLAADRIAAAEAADADAVVVYDVPLLVEANVQMPWNLVVVAEAPVETRVQRMVELRGMTREEAEQRISNQASDEERRAIADVVIDTGRSIAETLAQADELWKRIVGDATPDATSEQTQRTN